MGKLAQALAHGAQAAQVEGNFDDCLRLARDLADYPVALVNSVNPFRIEGQKTAAFEIVDALGDAPDSTAAGRQRRQHLRVLDGLPRVRPTASPQTPGMWGFQAAGAAPIVPGSRSPTRRPSPPRSASATRRPGSTRGRARRVRRSDRGGHRPPDPRRLPPARPPARASSSSPRRPRASPACSRHATRTPTPGQTVVCTVTGHGLKDTRPLRAISGAPAPLSVPSRPQRPAASGLVSLTCRRAVRVRVPATRANLGPGFDALGLALRCTTTSTSRSSTAGLARRGRGRGRRAGRATRRPGRARPPRRRSTRMGGGRRPAVRCVNRSRTAAGSAPRRRRSSAGWRGAGPARRRRGAARRGRPAALAARSRGIPTTSRRAASAGSPIAWPDEDGAPPRPARRRPAGTRRGVRAATPVSTDAPAGCCRTGAARRRRGERRPGGAAGRGADRRPGTSARDRGPAAPVLPRPAMPESWRWSSAAREKESPAWSPVPVRPSSRSPPGATSTQWRRRRPMDARCTASSVDRGRRHGVLTRVGSLPGHECGRVPRMRRVRGTRARGCAGLSMRVTGYRAARATLPRPARLRQPATVLRGATPRARDQPDRRRRRHAGRRCSPGRTSCERIHRNLTDAPTAPRRPARSAAAAATPWCFPS